MKLEIRSITTPDIDVPLQAWRPTFYEDVSCELSIEIGEAGKKEADLFRVWLATPEAIRSRSKDGNNVISNRASIVVAEFDWRLVEAALTQMVIDSSRHSWADSCLALQRFFIWEYE